MCFFGIGRGMLGSIIANSLGMVTKEKNRTLLFSFYTFACNLGNVIYITIFAKITNDQTPESYETGLAIFSGVSLIAFVITVILFFVDAYRGWILVKTEKIRK